MQEREADKEEIDLAVATISKVFEDPLAEDERDAAHVAEGVLKGVQGIIDSIGKAGRNLR